MLDRGLLLVLCRDDEIHIAAPFSEIEIIITQPRYFVKEMNGLSRKNRAKLLTHTEKSVILIPLYPDSGKFMITKRGMFYGKECTGYP